MSATRKDVPGLQRAKRRPNFGRFFAVIIVLGIAGLVGSFVAHREVDPKASFSSTLTAMFSPLPPPEEVFHKNRLSVLILGIDYNYDDKDQEYSAGARSDTIMAASLDLPTHSLHVISVPRDMEYTFADGHIDKINSAYSLGGPHAAERAVANFLGIPGFDRYVVLRINATKSLVDAIGGIDVPVTEAMDYDDSWGHLHIHFKPGLQHMDGDQAVSYSRFRHDACSDPCRIKRQQQVMRIIIAKLKNEKLNDLTHITSLIDVFNRNVLTDFSSTEKLSLAGAYANFNVADLKSDQIPYVDDRVLANAGDVLIPDSAAKEHLVNQYFLAPTSMPSADPLAASAIDPTQVHLVVQNGSGKAGMGKIVADLLHSRGFVIDEIGNASSFDHTTTEIDVAAETPGLGERIRQDLALPTAIIQQQPDPVAKAATVIVGRDFVPPAQPAVSDIRTGILLAAQ